MTPPQTQTLRGSKLPAPAMPGASAAPAAASAPPRPAFYLTVAFVFVVYARFPEIMDMVTGAGFHSVRIIVLLALMAALLFGGAIKAVFSRVGICMLSFTAWLCICTPFSVWRGGSFHTLRDFWALSLFSFVIIAASVQGLEQCRKIGYSLAAATIFIESFTLIMGRVQSGRLALVSGTLGNSNYLAMMLLMGVPFCLYVIRTKPGISVLKLASVLMMFLIPATVATTGSRGGLVTLAVLFILFFLPLPLAQKIAAGICAVILAVIAIVWSPSSALDRYRSMFVSSEESQYLTGSEQSAIESMELRKELLLSSLQLTLRHPLMGVGPGMFATANADYTLEITGKEDWNAWHETHNTFTQLSCEDGLPGLILYCLTLLFCFKIVFAVDRRARQYPALTSVRHIAYALRLALIAFTGTAIFASNAYAYYFPMLAGLCVALERAAKEQFALQTAAEPAAAVAAPQQVWVPGRLRPRSL